jgi:hypothetical protein
MMAIALVFGPILWLAYYINVEESGLILAYF